MNPRALKITLRVTVAGAVGVSVNEILKREDGALVEHEIDAFTVADINLALGKIGYRFARYRSRIVLEKYACLPCSEAAGVSHDPLRYITHYADVVCPTTGRRRDDP
jgi:hypothetical protein